ncbi:MAG: hypothetical protein VST71_03490 [Nitrospirota bacterium]|nr:hypothetical protein [Nitrospirota bacterium]
MGFLSNLFGDENFAGQISDRGVKYLLANLDSVDTEVLNFLEPTHHIWPEQQMFIPNLMGEFRDSKVGIVHGQGGGHAFIRMNALKSIAQEHIGEISNYCELVKLFRASGLEVKRIKYFRVEEH